jgi:hypothetical protein
MAGAAVTRAPLSAAACVQLAFGDDVVQEDQDDDQEQESVISPERLEWLLELRRRAGDFAREVPRRTWLEPKGYPPVDHWIEHRLMTAVLNRGRDMITPNCWPFSRTDGPPRRGGRVRCRPELARRLPSACATCAAG